MALLLLFESIKIVIRSLGLQHNSDQ